MQIAPHPCDPRVQLREVRVVVLYYWCEVSLLLRMALFKYFSPSGFELPTATETGIGEVATKQANQAVREYFANEPFENGLQDFSY